MDLSTNYLGLELKNPIVPSASPLSGEISLIKQMEDSGAAAVVLYSLFEEQILREEAALEHYLNYGGESFAEAISYFPTNLEYNHGPVDYLEHIRKAKEAVEIPIIASLNGFTTGGWLKYAKLFEEAGAEALELNLYNLPMDFNKTAIDVENEYLEIIKEVTSLIKIPVAIKLSPYFTSLPYFS
jgi:dihydroorotate dehydrogenase (fumarate)